MFQAEKRILMDVALKRCSAKQLINQRNALGNQFIGQSLDSLVGRGYLKRNGAKKYQLTPLGWGVLLQSPLKNVVCDKRDFMKLLYEDEVRSRDAVKKLEAINVEFSKKMDRLCEKQLEVI